jgi:hypothetical protein
MLAGGCQCVEGVEGALVGCYRDHSALLEQVADDVGSPDGVIGSEEDLHVFSEAAGVVVADCLAVSECLQERIAGKDLALNGVVLLLAQTSNDPHTVLGGLRLARS